MSLFSFLFRKQGGPQPSDSQPIPEAPTPPARALNVLLYLSTKQLPHPVDEMVDLAQRAGESKNGSDSVPFVTTRFLSGLTPDESEVALFTSDEKGGYELLARANFRGFVDRDTAEWDELISNDPTYEIDRMPETARGAIRLGNLKLLAESISIVDLDGRLADGERLTEELITRSPISDHEIGFQYTSLYYVKCGSEIQDVTAGERISLLLAKNDELTDKVSQLAEFWNDKKFRFQEIFDDNIEEDQKLIAYESEIREFKEEKIKMSSRQQKSDLVDSLLSNVYKNLEFVVNSGSILFNYCASSKSVWDVVRLLNDNKYVDKETYVVKKFKSTKCPSEKLLNHMSRM